jgi:hypothetical protein
MPWTIETKSKRGWPACLAAGVILMATMALGTFTGSARAEERWEHRDYDHRGWNGGYYRAPPVVYGSPYYYPPVVYGYRPGLNINIR